MSKTPINAIVLVLAAIGVLAIGFVGGYSIKSTASPRFEFPDTLNADTASGGKYLSCSTGWVDDDVEGLFVLDHMTGTLFCWIINPKTGVLGASFQTNVRSDLVPEGKEADSDYVMVTGIVNFSGRQFSGNAKPANTVVYVGEGNSGRVAAYMLRWRGADGSLERIGVGQTREPGR